jgi:hypothetical protein
MGLIRKLFFTKVHIKIISLVFGYLFWYILSQSHTTKIWLEVPICFYDLPQNMQIDSREKIKIELSAKRCDLYTIDMENLAFHINTQKLTPGKHIVKLSEEQLLLPEAIKMVGSWPSSIPVLVK